MSKSFFQLLARLNKLLLPSFYKRDLRRLKPWEKALVGWKVWVVKKILP
jgi:hypothetical protein